MLDERTARLVTDAINEESMAQNYGSIITLSEARRMDEVKISEFGGHAILSFQRGDLTILAHISGNEDAERTVAVKFVSW